jgi:photoactive yellow protein
MLDLAEPSSAYPAVDPHGLDDLSDAELDALPFGAIALDGEGTVLRYNLYESRFARIDRNQVVGRNFFLDVAHCTRTEAFEGRFRAFASAGRDEAVERFEYLFDFKFGAQEVSVEIVRAGGDLGDPRFYLLINRKSVGAPRPDFPRELLSAAQSDLAPDEPHQGVLRDTLERRFVDAPAPLFAALRATCDRLAPETWEIFAGEWGVQWGRRAAVDLEATVLEKSGRSLREVPMREASDLVCAYFAERGWGAPRFDFSHTVEGVLVVHLTRSALAEAAPRPRRSPAAGTRADLACHLIAGSLGAILSSLAGRRLAAREVACAAGGAPACSIVVIGHERRAAADLALKQGARGVDAVREALRRAPRAGGSP